MIYDLIIIGGGCAGLAASIYANRAALEHAVIEKLYAGGQLANIDTIDNYPGLGELSGVELILKLESHAKKHGLNVLNEEVTSLKIENGTEGHIITVNSNENKYRAKTVILAMGARPRQLGIPGEAEFLGRGVSYCATCDGALYRGKDAAVIGGGNTAVEEAVFLSRFLKKVWLVHRRGALRADKAVADRLKEHSNIEVIYNAVPAEIIGETKVSGLKLTDTATGERRSLDIDCAFVAIGTEPNSGLVKNLLNTDDAGFIITDERMRTNVPGIFAAGDVRNTPLRQVITAAADGAVAAHSASAYLDAGR